MLPEEAEMEFLKVLSFGLQSKMTLLKLIKLNNKTNELSDQYNCTFLQIFGCWIVVFNTSCVFHAFIDCTAATRVRGAVSQSCPWKETYYWRAGFGNLCQRYSGIWSQEQFSDVKPQISLDRDRQSVNKCKFTAVICVAYIACLALFLLLPVTCHFKLKHLRDVLCEGFNHVLLFLP